MKISYDEMADAVYITLKEQGVERTVRIGSDIAIDYGPNGEIYGIEILSARENFEFEEKEPKIEIENLKIAS